MTSADVTSQPRQLGSAVSPIVQLKTIVEAVGANGTDNIAVAGEYHNELDHGVERGFWADVGTNVVYENELHYLTLDDSKAVPYTFDDIFERVLYSIDSLATFMADYDLSEIAIPKGEASATAGELKLSIEQSRDYMLDVCKTIEIELKNMKGVNERWKAEKLRPIYSEEQVDYVSRFPALLDKFRTDAIEGLADKDVARFEGWAKTRIEEVATGVKHFHGIRARGRALAGIDSEKSVSVARSESMYANLHGLHGLIRDKSVYKVGENHAKDIKQLLDGSGLDPGFEVKTRKEYLEETGLQGGEVSSTDRSAGTARGGAAAITDDPAAKKGQKVADIRGQLSRPGPKQ